MAGSLPRPKRVRLLCAPDDRAWAGKLAGLLEALPEPVMVDVSPAGESIASGTASVILVWSHITERNASVFREINDWDRGGIPIHILRINEAAILAFLINIAATVSTYTDDADLTRWIRVEVLRLGEDMGDGQRPDALARFHDAADSYRRALVDRLSFVTVVGRHDKERLDSLYLQLFIIEASLSLTQTARDLVEVLAGTQAGRLFVVGTAGAGKSTMLDYTAWRLAQDDHEERLPVLLRATEPRQFHVLGYN